MEKKMSTKKDILSKALKKNPAPAASFGTDPLDPWSKRSNITEDEDLLEASRQELLNKYLYSKGINPKFVTKDVRISHSKSGPFLKYQRDHQNDPEPSNPLGEGNLDELSDKTLKSYVSKAGISAHHMFNKAHDAVNNDASSSFKLSHKAINRMKNQDKAYAKVHSEDTYNDPKAATQDNGGMGGADLVEKTKKKAKLVKSIFKKKMHEELTDPDKESKSVATYGKKPPKVSGKEFEKKLNADDEVAARAVLKGGTTMTGEKRDTIIIDPSMRKPIKGMNKQPDFPQKDGKISPR